MLVRLLGPSRLRLWSTNHVSPAQVIPSVVSITILHPRHSRGLTSGNTEEYFSRKSLQQAEDSVLRQFLYCSTILTKEPAKIPSAILISRLPELTSVTPQTGIPSVVFLLTPSLAHLLNEGHCFLHDAVSRLFPVADTIKTVVAVVDRLPKGQNSTGQDVGGEGLSVLVMVSDPKSQSAYHQQSAIEAESAGPGPDPGTEEGKHISFFIPAKLDLPQPLTTYHHFQRAIVPLANTIFQNGQRSTLLLSHWSRARNSQELRCIPLLGIKGSNIFLPRDFNEWRFVSHIPLISVTVPRRIAASFGNIIRQISLDPIQTLEGEGTDIPFTTVVPASQELESAVQAYFERQSLEPHKVTIWALVTPQEHISREYLGVYEDNTARNEHWLLSEKPHRLGRPIQMKFRDCLHRVLSGGGGWGKKQGLLALDPEISCRERGGRPSELETGEEHGRQVALSEIAKPGDFVQFFIQHPMPNPMQDGSDVRFPQSAIVFGSVPSSIDEIPDEDFNPPPQCQGQLEVIKDQFGALSEHGIVHQRVSSAISKCDGRGPQLRQPDFIEQTKIDVPYSKFCFYHRKGSEKSLDRV
ncbi:MAG: hypothetical protein M1840_008611 [Geoglossum simile]|nr:MAG: hypothetical protein M1840_008611 [Geoglossum simile]